MQPTQNDYSIDLILRLARIAAFFLIFYTIAISVGSSRQRIALALLGVGIIGLSSVLISKYGVKHHR